jgi:hypothetical protein
MAPYKLCGKAAGQRKTPPAARLECRIARAEPAVFTRTFRQASGPGLPVRRLQRAAIAVGLLVDQTPFAFSISSHDIEIAVADEGDLPGDWESAVG